MNDSCICIRLAKAAEYKKQRAEQLQQQQNIERETRKSLPSGRGKTKKRIIWKQREKELTSIAKRKFLRSN